MSIRDHLSQLFRTRDRRDQAQRMAIQERDRARSPEEEISQREERRLAGMSAEDRAWEQASLQRNREAQAQSTR
jgi:hypothetical protein